MSIESVMPSNHLVLCCPLLLLPSIFPSIRVFSRELALHIKWPKYWRFMHWRRKWQPTPVFLPGESQGRGAWLAAIYGVAQSRTRLKRLSSSSSSSMEQLIGSRLRKEYDRAVCCLFNLYTEYIMRNARLDELQAGIKIGGRNINILK